MSANACNVCKEARDYWCQRCRRFMCRDDASKHRCRKGGQAEKLPPHDFTTEVAQLRQDRAELLEALRREHPRYSCQAAGDITACPTCALLARIQGQPQPDK